MTDSPSAPATEPRYIVELTALPGHPLPGITRLRSALKLLLRAFKLRCDRLEEVRHD